MDQSTRQGKAQRGKNCGKRHQGAELHLWNKNVDEMICLLKNIQASGVWTRQETARHEARLELLRTQLNEDFRELITLKKRVDLLGLSEKNRGL